MILFLQYNEIKLLNGLLLWCLCVFFILTCWLHTVEMMREYFKISEFVLAKWMKSYGFGRTWEWINDIIFIFEWTNSIRNSYPKYPLNKNPQRLIRVFVFPLDFSTSFQLSWNKGTFPQHSNLLRCTCRRCTESFMKTQNTIMVTHT